MRTARCRGMERVRRAHARKEHRAAASGLTGDEQVLAEEHDGGKRDLGERKHDPVDPVLGRPVHNVEDPAGGLAGPGRKLHDDKGFDRTQRLPHAPEHHHGGHERADAE
eukprot:1538674-Rhodomonas_salina.2